MNPLATIDDLQGRLGRTLTGDELTRATNALADASATVRNYTRQQISQSTSTELCRMYGGTLTHDGVWYPVVVRLAQRPVTAVASVVDLDGNAVTFWWDGGQLVGLAPSATSENSFGDSQISPSLPVKVTYTHGWATGDPVYDTVIAVVCSVAGRAIGRAPEDGAVTQESITGYSYTVGAVGAAGALGLLPEEKERLSEIRGRKARSIGLFG